MRKLDSELRNHKANKPVWSKRATLRQSGEMARTVTLKFHLTRDDIAGIIGHASAMYGETVTAATLRERVENHLWMHGVPGPSIWDEVTAEETREAYALCDRVFPELKGGRPDEVSTTTL